MSVSTPFGTTEQIKLDKNVAQGDLMAPLEAAVQVDSVARALEEEDQAREREARPGQARTSLSLHGGSSHTHS